MELNKPKFIRDNDTFLTIYGRNLLAELDIILPDNYLIVTMEDLWEKYKHNFKNKQKNVYIVKGLDINKVNEDFKNLNNFSTIVGIGGGQSLDIAKYFAWKSSVKLFQVPTSMSVNATFGHRAAIRINSNVSYVGWTVPEAVYIDYDIIKEAPKEFNRSGICEIMCYHTAHLDWKYATKVGKCEKKWPYDQSAVNDAQSVLDYMLEGIDDIKEVNDNGIKRLMNANAWGGAAFHNFGWNPRPIEGTDHFVFYSLEYHTKRPYIHGQPVNFGVYLGSLLHETKAEEMFDYILRAGVDIRPEAMGITWDDMSNALINMKDYVNKIGLWHSIVHDKEIDENFVADLKIKIDNKYKTFNND
jgi:glycerol dehydrogenase-like iron-containing ADH family enzyme